MAPTTSKVSVTGLINAIHATLSGRSAEERLQLLGQTTAGELLNDELAFDSAMRMRSYSDLDDLENAETCVYNAREAYARHLGLTGLDIDAYKKNEYAFYDTELYKAREAEDVRENPWLYELFENGFAILPPSSYIGDTLEERRRNAKSAWSHFGRDEELRGYLAVLYMRLEKYAEAAAIIDGISNSPDIRGSEIRGELSLRSLWPLVLAGECYAALGKIDEAIVRWQKCRSLELYCEENTEFCSEFGALWIDKAKQALRNQGVDIPSLEQSKAASEHLASAWNWMLCAESWTGEMAVQELITKFNYSGHEFRNYVANASVALGGVHKLDPFTRAKVMSPEGTPVWVAPNLIVAQIWHMNGLIHLLMDQLDSAPAAFTQAVRTYSSLGSYLWLGVSYDLGGRPAEARGVYEYMLTHGKKLANPITEDDASSEELLAAANELRANPFGTG